MLNTVDFLNLHGRTSDSFDRGKNRIHFVKFDTESAKFNLIVSSSENLHIALIKPSCEVSGFINPDSVIIDEPLRRHFRQVVISCGNTDAADIKFTGNACGNFVSVKVHNKFDNARKRTTGIHGIISRQFLGIGRYGRLRRTVSVK